MKKISLAIALLLSACSTGNAIKDGLVTGGKIALRCAEEQVKAKASQIMPAILAILASDNDSWDEQADMYAQKYTTEVTICAARTALDKLTNPVQAEGLVKDSGAVKRTATARLRTLEIKANVQ